MLHIQLSIGITELENVNGQMKTWLKEIKMVI